MRGVPLLNFVGSPGIPLLNFEGGPGVPLLNFRGGPGSRGPGPTFTLCPYITPCQYTAQSYQISFINADRLSILHPEH